MIIVSLLLLVLTFNGGMYLGTILYSAWKSAEETKNLLIS